MKYICSDCLSKFDTPNRHGRHTGEVYIETYTCPECGSKYILKTTKKIAGLKPMLDWMKENGL